MKKLFCLSIFVTVLFSCSKNDNEELDKFYSNNDENAQNSDIYGAWAIYEAEYDGERTFIGSDFPSCGRNYFVFELDGSYNEYIYENANCNPKVSRANWQLKDGIIALTSTSSLTDEAAVVNASDEELVLKYRYDVDGDGKLDIFKVVARRYDPLANNHVTKSFKRDPETNSLLRFEWNQFTGPGEFHKYEIFRSNTNNCSKDNAELIATITNVSVNDFVDLNPPPTDSNLCYFLKVYSDDSLTGESALLSENPKNLVIPESANLNIPVVEESSIELTWDPVDIPYFSHYEIVYANSDARNLLFHEEESIVTLDDMEQSSFLDLDPPFLENPFFSVHVYNIFGSRVTSNYEGTVFRRKDLFGPIDIHSIAIDPDEPIIYFSGRSDLPDWANYEEMAVFRYNYNTGEIEAYSSPDDNLGYISTPPIKVISSPEGKELISANSSLTFFNPTTLGVKFKIETNDLYSDFGLIDIHDFIFLELGYWIMLDHDFVYVFERENTELRLIDKQIHFDSHQSVWDYKIFNTKDNQIIIGHPNEDNSIVINLSDDGELLDRETVPVPIKYWRNNTTLHSEYGKLILNNYDNEVYSTDSFELLDSFTIPGYPSGISLDGQIVFSSNNNPDWLSNPDRNDFFSREATLYNLQSNNIEVLKTKGFPLLIFENYQREILCVSSPYKEGIYDYNTNLFVEKVVNP